MERRTHHWGWLGLVLCVFLGIASSGSSGEQLAAFVPTVLEAPQLPDLAADTAWRQAVPSWPMLAQNDEGESLNPFRAETTFGSGARESITGTDPRAFDTLFDLYYRYAEMDNDFTQQDLILAGQVPLTENLAVTGAFPVLRYAEFDDTPTFLRGTGSLPDNLGDTPWTGGAGVAAADLDSGGDEWGIGDIKLGAVWRFDTVEAKAGDTWERQGDQLGDVLVSLDLWIPTATEDVLGNDAWILTPGVHWVQDTRSNGFIALMNYYDWSFTREDGPAVSRLRGQWYFMQPLTDLGDGVTDGLYIQPEIQPTYDFEEEEFAFWAGGELGKVVTTGAVVYVKPGWGVSPDDGEREFTIEAGLRWFF